MLNYYVITKHTHWFGVSDKNDLSNAINSELQGIHKDGCLATSVKWFRNLKTCSQRGEN